MNLVSYIKCFLLVIIVFSSLAVPGHAESYKAVDLSKGPKHFARDSRVILIPEATVELSIKALKPTTKTGPVPIVSFIGRAGFTIWMREDAQAIGISYDETGQNVRYAPVDLTGQDFVNLAFVVNGTKTTIHLFSAIHLELQNPTVTSLQAGPAEGYEVRIGGSDAQPFKGYVRNYRLWNKALDFKALQDLNEQIGRPKPLSTYDIDDLIQYARFTDTSQQLLFTQPKVEIAMASFSDAGKQFLLPLPRKPKSELPSFHIIYSKSADDYRLKGIQLGYYINGKLAMLLPRSLGHSDAASVISGDRFQGRAKLNLQKIRPKSGAQSFEPLVSPLIIFSSFNGIVGRHNGTVITHIGLTHDAGLLHPNDSGRQRDDEDSFHLALPSGTRAVGLIVQQSDEGVHGVGLAYTKTVPDARARRLEPFLGKVLVRRSHGAPRRMSRDIMNDKHGSFDNQDTYVLRKWPDYGGVFLYGVPGDGSAPWIRYYEHVTDSQYRLAKALPDRLKQQIVKANAAHGSNAVARDIHDKTPWLEHETLTFFKDHVRLNTNFHPPNQKFRRVVTLVPPRPYQADGPEKLTWGATFALDQRAPRSRANFVGYDIFRMHTWDYQASVNQGLNVFQYPKDTSKSYVSSDSKLIYPQGLFLDTDLDGAERSQTRSFSSSSEYSQFWSGQIGLSIGVPGIASFAANGSHSEQTQRSFSSKGKTAIARTRSTKYGLVMDRGHMKLDPLFRRHIEDMADLVQTGGYPDTSQYLRELLDIVRWIGVRGSQREKLIAQANGIAKAMSTRPLRSLQFFRQYGTHYPYAATYGGMVLAQVYSSETGSGTDSEQSTAVEVQASGMLEEVQLGANGKFEHKSGTKFASSQGDERAYYDSVGGTMSRGGGWSLGHGEEVPILLDLRPIYDLLNPVLFENPAVWLKLRANMQAEFELLSRYHQYAAVRSAGERISDAERILATVMGVLYDADVYP